MADNELGMFLRSRRDARTPADVGIPAGDRRRAPGLRRSEVAALAGVSVEYVTRLEQGRDRAPSAQVLAALADALRLTTSERVHLQRLAKGADGHFRCHGPHGRGGPARDVRPTVRALLDRLEPAAAVVLGRGADVVACTPAYRRLMAPAGLFDAPVPNPVRYVLTDARARDLYPDWDDVADHAVATLKQGPYRADPVTAHIADELALLAGAAFTDRERTIPGLPAASGVVRLRHPRAGGLRLAYETLELPADDDQRLVVHLPADDATAAALEALPPLRLLGSA